MIGNIKLYGMCVSKWLISGPIYHGGSLEGQTCCEMLSEKSG